VSRRYRPRQAPGRCRRPADRCRCIIAAAAGVALTLKAWGEPSPDVADLLEELAADAEHLLGGSASVPGNSGDTVFVHISRASDFLTPGRRRG